MISTHVPDSELMPFIEAAFDQDEELLLFYDREEPADSIADATKNVFDKICHLYPGSTCFGILDDDHNPIGYFAFSKDHNILISFGLNKKYRVAAYLREYWNLILLGVGTEDFSCTLYSYNTRAIKWLEKMGMTKVFNNVTMLKLCQQED